MAFCTSKFPEPSLKVRVLHYFVLTLESRCGVTAINNFLGAVPSVVLSVHQNSESYVKGRVERVLQDENMNISSIIRYGICKISLRKGPSCRIARSEGGAARAGIKQKGMPGTALAGDVSSECSRR